MNQVIKSLVSDSIHDSNSWCTHVVNALMTEWMNLGVKQSMNE